MFIGFTFSCFVGEYLGCAFDWVESVVRVAPYVTHTHKILAVDSAAYARGVAHEVSALAAVHLRLLNRLLALFFLPCHIALSFQVFVSYARFCLRWCVAAAAVRVRGVVSLAVVSLCFSCVGFAFVHWLQPYVSDVGIIHKWQYKPLVEQHWQLAQHGSTDAVVGFIIQ